MDVENELREAMTDTVKDEGKTNYFTTLLFNLINLYFVIFKVLLHAPPPLIYDLISSLIICININAYCLYQVLHRTKIFTVNDTTDCIILLTI